MKTLIIADIAGQFDALIRLVSRFPDHNYVLVGDLVDRGPKSKEVVEWAMNNPRVTSLMGNHEHMMLDHLLELGCYDQGLWLYNGGGATHRSYEYNVPENVLTWLKTRPLFKMLDNCLVTHAPLEMDFEISDMENAYPCEKPFDLRILWNRHKPIRRPYFQIFGHNSHWGLEEINDNDGVFALCIDQSQSDLLTGVTWPECEVYTEPYERQTEVTL